MIASDFNVDDIIPYDKNPRMNQEAVLEVARSIEEFGFNQPILIDQNNRICVGHTRWEAMKSLGKKTLPCIVKKMTNQEFIRYNIADNKTGEIAEWDDELLLENLLLLDELDIPGFEIEEFEALMEGLEDTPPIKDKPDSKRSSSETKKLVFNCTSKQAKTIDGKLDLILREHGLENQVEALLYALQSFKGPARVKRIRRS